MQYVSIEVVEEDKSVALVDERFAQEDDGFGLEELIGCFEIVVCNGQMPDARIFKIGARLGRFKGSGGRDDFQHGTVRSLHEKVAGIGEIDVESEMFHVPLRELFGVGRGDRRVFQTYKHKTRL